MKFCTLLCVFAACSAAQVAPPKPTIEPNAVVARIDGKDVTALEIHESLIHMPADFQRFFEQNPVYAVQQIYMMRYLSTLAENAKLAEKSPLKEQIEIARQNLLASAMMSYEQNSYRPSREAIQAHYDKNRTNYQQAKVRLIRISFNAPSGAADAPGLSTEERARKAVEEALNKNQRSEAQARERATEVMAKLKNGASLESLVTEYTDDAASKISGGAATVDHANTFPAEIKKAILALMAGELSQLLRLPDAFLIIKMEEKSIEPLSSVETPVIQELRAAHLNEWFASVNSRFTPQVQMPEFFRPATAVPPPPAAPVK